MALVAGVDSSTQATKVVVVDTDNAKLVAQASAPHRVMGTGGARETMPSDWADALGAALAATGRASEVRAVSVAAQQHGLVVLGNDDQVLRAAILWNDTRSASDAAALVEALGGPELCARRVGSVLTPAFTISSWAWLCRTEPEIARAARRVCLPHDYLSTLLVGGEPPCTDRSDVSGTGWWSPADESYAEDVLGLPGVGLRPEMLPRILGPGEAAGEVSASASQRFGLPTGAVVGAGAGDNAGAALSLGVGPGEAAVSLGTSGTVFSVASAPSTDATGVVAGFASADGRYLPLACTLNATLAVDRVAQWLGLSRDDVAPSGDLLFLPWFDGERTPNLPWASGTLSGLRHDTDPRSLLQAAYEGAVGTLLAAIDELATWAPMGQATPLLLVGGGARSRIWQDTVMRLSGRPLLLPQATELVALGAAVQAAAVLEGTSPQEIAQRWDLRRGSHRDAVPRDEAVTSRLRTWITKAATSGTVPIEGRSGGPSPQA